MRKLFLLFVAGLGFQQFAAAQLLVPGPYMNSAQASPIAHYNRISDTAALSKKWSVNKYAAFSAGYMFTNGGGASLMSVPVGIQLVRRLNNNLFAFAGVNAAPTYFNPNGPLLNTGINKGYPGYNFNVPKGLGLNTGLEAGLMYTNDERTFSVSGSINVNRSSYPLYPMNQFNSRAPQQAATGKNY